MNRTEAFSNIKGTVLGLEYGKKGSEMKLVQKTRIENSAINISVFIKIRQKEQYDDDIFLHLVQIDNNKRHMLFITSLSLDPEKRTNNLDGSFSTPESGIKLVEDEYKVIQYIRYNLRNIPMCGTGQYALVLVSEKGDLNSLIDAYYFTVE